MKHPGETPVPDSNGGKLTELESRVEEQPQADSGEGSENSMRDSGQTYDMQKIREVVENTPDIREDKVAVLKKMIASGEYQVNAREVADKMIKEFLLDDGMKR